MATPHSSVMYVEPNYVFNKFTELADDGDTHDRAPDLEDYCISLDIIVELSSRNCSISQNTPSGDRTIIMSYTSGNGTKENVRFMSGTMIGGYEKESNSTFKPRLAGENVLSSYYADMHITDLVDYGTTELLGIKSVDVDYNSTCVPVITIKFTDVRGMSIFQPSELNDDLSFNGIRGFSKDNIAQSFFHAFFTVPLPRFTIKLKGFYGRPVSYQVMCDKFDTAFDSKSGSFDVTARFIGYAYSFMSDVSFNALLAAPYSDYEGEKYWETQVTSGRFMINDKDGIPQKMPKLYEIRRDIERIINESDKNIQLSAAEGETDTHEIEIRKLTELRGMYTAWYDNFYETCCNKYGADYCYRLRTGNGDDDDYSCVFILTNGKNIASNSLRDEYLQYDETFRELTGHLVNAIDDFNKSNTSYRKLDTIKPGFDYAKTKTFREVWINYRTNKYMFDGFHADNKLPTKQVIDAVFGNESDGQQNALRKIYNDGNYQYIDAFVVSLNYSDIKTRISALIDDANKQKDEKAKKRKEINRHMYEKMGWYPSVENLMKIVMAHLETLMHMMYSVVDQTKNRTLSSLGVTSGEYGIVDANSKDDNVAPFPRITVSVTDKDGYTKSEDTWVGNFVNGEGFKEVDMVNGLFNGVSVLGEIEGQIETAKNNAMQNANSGGLDEKAVTVVPMPITSYDFTMTKCPYGNMDDMNDNIAAFAGKVCMRMFGILALNSFVIENESWLSYAEKLGAIEAHNFQHFKKITNAKLLGLISANGMYGNGEQLLKIAMGYSQEKNLPWDDENWRGNGRHLFNYCGKEKGIWLTRYRKFGVTTPVTTYVTAPAASVQPIQNFSFEKMQDTLNIINQGKYPVDNEDIILIDSLDGLDKNTLARIINKSDNSTVFNALMFTDRCQEIWAKLDNAVSMSDCEEYKEISTLLANGTDSSSGIKQDLSDMGSAVVVTEGNSSFNRKIDDRYIAGKTVVRGKCDEEEPAIAISTIDFDTQYEAANKGGYGYGDVQFKMPEIRKVGGNTEEEKEEVDSLEDNRKYTFELSRDGEAYVNEMSTGNIQSFTLTECYAFKKENGKKALDKSKSLFLTYEYYDEPAWPGDMFIVEDARTANFLMGIDCINYSIIEKCMRSNVFVYVPKLAVLQIGAAMAYFYSANGINIPFDVEKVKEGLAVSSTFYKIVGVVNGMSSAAKIAMIKNFKDWATANYSLIKELSLQKYANLTHGAEFASIKSPHYDTIMIEEAADSTWWDVEVKRAVFNQKSEVIKKLTNELMKLTCVVRLNTCAIKSELKAGEDGTLRDETDTRYKSLEEFKSYRYSINESTAIAYLDSFLNTLRGLNGMSNSRTPTTIAEDPSQTTEDMKIELYRYLKQLYDKWASSTSMESWMFDQFFNGENSNNQIGNNFYFIDSFYNKIGNKLLINPTILSDVIKLTTSSKDTNVMMYSFLSQLLSQHRCMLKCVQNFKMLTEGIGEIFIPKPYNGMGVVNPFPDFVVIYSYEASKNLNVANSEYKDDGFMLNDEFETPMPIKSRVDDNSFYKIPAFGVSYGRQYQHYFKSVNVNMSQPIMTEQAIIAKHNVLAASRSHMQKNIAAQDLYDIYSNQSYTCTVEMMGCAFVQPLMYFVLLNVPFFKGSYLISKVRHRMTPGDMTTEITGVRMSKYCNRMVVDMFTDEEDTTSEPTTYEEIAKGLLADTSNNCEYRVYPVSENVSSGKEGKMDESMIAKGLSIINKLMGLGCNRHLAAGLAGNMSVESRFNPAALNPNDKGFMSGGLVQWRAGNLISMLNNTPSKHGRISDTDSDNVKGVSSTNDERYERIKSIISTKNEGYQCEYLIETMKRADSSGSYIKGGMNFGKFNLIEDEVEAAKEFMRKYEVCEVRDSDKARWENATLLYNRSLGAESDKKTEETDGHDPNKFARQFVSAIQKSLNSTSSYAGNIEAEYRSDGKGVDLSIPNGGEKLAVLFDIIVNSESYYRYVRKLDWLVNNSPTELPSGLRLVVEENVQSRTFYVDGYGNKNSGKVKIGDQEVLWGTAKFTGDDCNEKLMQTFAKKYGSNKDLFVKECPQFSRAKDSIDKFKITDCGTLYGDGKAPETASSPSPVSSSANITIDGWNVAKAVQWINQYSRDSADGACKQGSPRGSHGCRKLCATYVEIAISKGGGPLATKMACGDSPRTGGPATNLHYGGILKKNGFELISSGECTPKNRAANITPQAGDVAIIGRKSSGVYHACLWNGEQWVSDYKQGASKMSPYSGVDNYPGGTLPFFIYRFHNKQGTSNS